MKTEEFASAAGEAADLAVSIWEVADDNDQALLEVSVKLFRKALASLGAKYLIKDQQEGGSA